MNAAVLDEMTEIFHLQAHYCTCFSNEKRLQILYLLKEGEKSVGEIAETMGLTQQNVSQHLRIMKDRGVLRSRKSGQTVYYRISNMKFIRGCEMIQEALREELAKHKVMVS